MRTLLAVALLLGLFAGAASADEILLKNGMVIRGKIVSEGDDDVVIRISSTPPGTKAEDERFVEMKLSKDRIKSITRDSTIFTPVERTSAEKQEAETAARGPVGPVEPASGDAAKSAPAAEENQGGAAQGHAPVEPATAEAKKTAEKKTPAADQDALDPAVQLQVDALLRSFDSTSDPAQREKNEDRLAALGEKVAPLLIKTLNVGGQDQKQTSLAKVLEKLKDKRAVQALIMQLKGDSRNEYRMYHAWLALKAITGQDIWFDKNGGQNTRSNQVTKWQEWFDGVKESYPAQIGFESDKTEETKAGENEAEQ